jgi:hypothetical protein
MAGMNYETLFEEKRDQAWKGKKKKTEENLL